jgi:hypothetical protein
MEREGSLPHSQQPANCPYPEYDNRQQTVPAAHTEPVAKYSLKGETSCVRTLGKVKRTSSQTSGPNETPSHSCDTYGRLNYFRNSDFCEMQPDENKHLVLGKPC